MTLLAIITPRAIANELPFMFIGGHAVMAHGYGRNTFDLDLVIRDDDVQRWTVLASDLGYVLFRKRPAFLQFKDPKEETMPLDLMHVNDNTFDQLFAESQEFPRVPGSRYVSLKHLMALKCHAIKHGGRERELRDMNDLIQLAGIHHINVDEPQWRELILKHENSTIETLEFPDWTGMADTSSAIRPETAFELCDEYFRLFKDAAKRCQQRPKCDVKFVL